MKEKCFAERKDGTCHALKHKKCSGCKFYFPRKFLKHNPIYAYSYETDYAHRSAAKLYKVPENFIMWEND